MAKKTPKQFDLTRKEVEGCVKPKNRSKRERYREFAENFMNAADSETYFNATKSALKAGYSPGYVRGNAYKLVGRRGIVEEIEAIKLEKRGNPNIASADDVLETLTTQIRVLPNELFDPETKELINPADMDKRLAQAIAGYKVTRRVIPGFGEGGQPGVETKYEFKLVDRQVALEKLGRWHGIWGKDNRQKAPPAPQVLVNFPSRELSLEEWQAAALAILRKQDEEPSLMHIRQGLNRVESL